MNILPYNSQRLKIMSEENGIKFSGKKMKGKKKAQKPPNQQNFLLSCLSLFKMRLACLRAQSDTYLASQSLGTLRAPMANT